MNRRDFVKMLALLAAGAAARPEQIAAFEQYYEVNTPQVGGPFVAIDEVVVSGLASVSFPVNITFNTMDSLALTAGLNAFGGIFFWRAAPDSKIITEPNDFRWRMHIEHKRFDPAESYVETPSDEWVRHNLQGHIKYIDQSGVRITRPIIASQGRLI